MSKAFTREEDDRPESPLIRRPELDLPPGVKNYLTPDGANRLRQELDRLTSERPSLAERPDQLDSQEALARLDERIRQLRRILHWATVVRPPMGPIDRVRFGATVTVRSRDGEETRYRIVGIPEADADEGRVSWQSPIAKALLNSRTGDRVRFQTPAGDDELEILSVVYG